MKSDVDEGIKTGNTHNSIERHGSPVFSHEWPLRLEMLNRKREQDNERAYPAPEGEGNWRNGGLYSTGKHKISSPEQCRKDKQQIRRHPVTDTAASFLLFFRSWHSASCAGLSACAVFRYVSSPA